MELLVRNCEVRTHEREVYRYLTESDASTHFQDMVRENWTMVGNEVMGGVIYQTFERISGVVEDTRTKLM